MVCPVRLDSVRPLVRYVDEDVAVIDTHFSVRRAVLADDTGLDDDPNPSVTVHVEVHGDRGFFDEGDTEMRLKPDRGSVRFEVCAPRRWWPAGMGEQALYTLKLALLHDGDMTDEREVTFGLSSVRRDHALGEEFAPVLLVNGRICEVRDVLVVDKADAAALLPATGESLLLVRDHFGDQTLYDAADRAGILLVQAVPIAHGEPGLAVRQQVDRLASHPSLAGYFVGHLGGLSDRVAAVVRELDPTRAVFRRFPIDPAA